MAVIFILFFLRYFTQGGYKPGKLGVLMDFYEHGKLREFSGNSVQPRGNF